MPSPLRRRIWAKSFPFLCRVNKKKCTARPDAGRTAGDWWIGKPIQAKGVRFQGGPRPTTTLSFQEIRNFGDERKLIVCLPKTTPQRKKGKDGKVNSNSGGRGRGGTSIRNRFLLFWAGLVLFSTCTTEGLLKECCKKKPERSWRAVRVNEGSCVVLQYRGLGNNRHVYGGRRGRKGSLGERQRKCRRKSVVNSTPQPQTTKRKVLLGRPMVVILTPKNG